MPLSMSPHSRSLRSASESEQGDKPAVGASVGKTLKTANKETVLAADSPPHD